MKKINMIAGIIVFLLGIGLLAGGLSSQGLSIWSGYECNLNTICTNYDTCFDECIDYRDAGYNCNVEKELSSSGSYYMYMACASEGSSFDGCTGPNAGEGTFKCTGSGNIDVCMNGNWEFWDKCDSSYYNLDDSCKTLTPSSNILNICNEKSTPIPVNNDCFSPTAEEYEFKCVNNGEIQICKEGNWEYWDDCGGDYYSEWFTDKCLSAQPSELIVNICAEKINPLPECKTGEIKTTFCSDGTTVPTARCINGEWSNVVVKCHTPPPECKTGEIKTTFCGDGTTVPTAQCINGEWSNVVVKCHTPPPECSSEFDCPEGKVCSNNKCINVEDDPDYSILIASIAGGILIIGSLIWLYYQRRNKK